MKILALAVLVAVMQASPRQTAATPTDDSQSLPKNAESNQRLADAQSAKETKNVRESTPMPKAATDLWYRAYVIFTGVLVVVGAAGVGYAMKTLKAIERQGDEMSKQRAAMENTLVATFRPKLIVRKVFLNNGTQIPTVGVPDAYPWTVDYAVANIGGTRATIRRSGFEFTAFDREIPAKLPYKMQPPAELIRIEPGEEKEFSVPIDSNLTNLFRILGVRGDLSHQKIGRAYFWGRAQYSDDREIIRNVAVCRHYRTETGKFEVVDDSDYEYAD
jgi:hypothetical protein